MLASTTNVTTVAYSNSPPLLRTSSCDSGIDSATDRTDSSSVLALLGCLAGIVILWFALEAATIRHGCDVTDFGQAATMIHRLANGDQPFVDCLSNSVALAEFYVAQIVRVFGPMSMGELRILNSAISLVGCLCLFDVLRRVGGSWAAMFATAVAIATTRLWFTQVPSYHTVPSMLAMACVMLFLYAWRSSSAKGAIGFAIGAGIVAALAAFARMPLFGIILLPIGFMLPAIVGRLPLGTRRWACGTYAVAFAIVTASMGLWAISTGGERVLGHFRLITSREAYAVSSVYGAGLQAALLWGAEAWRGLSLMVILAILASRVFRDRSAWLRLSMILGVAIYCGWYVADQRNHGIHVLGIGLAGAVIIMAMNWPNSSDTRSTRAQSALVSGLSLTSIAMALMFVAGSNQGLLSGIHGSQLLIGLCALLLIRAAWTSASRTDHWFPDRRMNCLGAVVLLGAVTIGSLYWWFVNGSYRDFYSVRRPGAHIAFKSPALAGVTSTPERVSAIDRLVECVQSHVGAGAIILAYYDVPLVYFATETRPALFAGWAMENWPNSLEQAALDDMLQRDRIPALVVRNREFPGRMWPLADPSHPKRYPDDAFSMNLPDRRPLNAWVAAHYELRESIGPFDVLLPRSTSRDSQGAADSSLCRNPWKGR